MEKTEEKKERFLYKDLDDELLIYDSKSDCAHFLNGTAKLVFQLLQKKYSIEDIKNEIRKKFKAEDDKKIDDDIRKICEDFKAKELIE